MGSSRRPRSRWAATRPTEPSSRWRQLLPLLGAAVAMTVAGCAGSLLPGAQAARDWSQGPARWLLLPDEKDALEEIASTAELATFLQAFWRRRDDDPSTPEVPQGEVYAQRVSAGDRLYAEDGVRGSLTDRGGALLLLGPPSILSYSNRQAPSRESNRSQGVRPTRPVRLEIWTYLPADLSPEVAAELAPDLGRRGLLELTFLAGPQHTRLIEGRDYLERAACGWARCSAPR
jgi:GWxTD domain-containing protein